MNKNQTTATGAEVNQSEAKVHCSVGLGVNRVGTKILGLAWGEQDRPDAALLASVDEVRNFIVQEWLGAGDSAILDEVMRDLAAHDWEESREKTWTFEVGGLSLQDVYDMTPNVELSDRRENL